MTRRKLPVKSLPLESSEWVPLGVVVQLWGERNGSLMLGEDDTLRALREGKVRGMRRLSGAKPELLPPEFWNGREIMYDGGEVFLYDVPGRFFCWQPDLEKIFANKTDPTKQPAQVREVPVKSGRKRSPERDELCAVAYAIATRKKHGELEKKQAAVIEELVEWCRQNKRKVPAPSTLAEIVSAALRIRTLLKQRPIR